LATAGSLVASVPLGSLAQVDELVDDARPSYIDMHTHLGQVWNTKEVVTTSALLHWMDASRIERAVVLPLVSPESASYPLSSEFVLAQTRPHRDRLIPFCCIDPRTSFEGGQAALVEMLRRYKEAGAKGFGEHKPGVPVDDERNMRLYEACAEVGLPVLFHLDNERNTDKPGLPGLETALKAHPSCNFVGHGPGWWASISGDADQPQLGAYPGGKVAPGGAIDRLMDVYDNIYGELSAGSGAGAMSRDLDFAREFLNRRQDRILFGTDFLSPGQDIPQFALFDEKLMLSADVHEKIVHGNARRLLSLD
jgi:predicted TIM-barrel fold metal-dependent hydrolase